MAARAREAAAELAPLPRRQGRRAARDGRRARRGHRRPCSPPTRRTSRRAARPGCRAALVDRLALDADRVAAMAQGLRDVAALPDPVGEVRARLHPAERAGDPPGPGAVRRRRDDLRGPPERDRRRRRARAQERQRRAAARVGLGVRVQLRARRRARRARPRRPACRATRSSSCPGTDRASRRAPAPRPRPGRPGHPARRRRPDPATSSRTPPCR